MAAGGDVIVAIDGEPVDSGDDVVAAVDTRNPGDQMELELIRDGEQLTITVTLGNRTDAVQPGGSAQGQAPELP